MGTSTLVKLRDESLGSADGRCELGKGSADLLVVGSRRPRTMKRAVGAAVQGATLGRVADIIGRSARCPVLVVHGDGMPQTSNA